MFPSLMAYATQSCVLNAYVFRSRLALKEHGDCGVREIKTCLKYVADESLIALPFHRYFPIYG